MRKLALIALVALCSLSAHAASCSVPAGSSTATAQAAINAAAANTCSSGATNTVLAGVGTSNLTSLTIPCPTSAGMIISGPVTSYPMVLLGARPTAHWMNATTGEAPPLLVASVCANPVTIQYMDIDGNHPISGGGSISIPTGNSGLFKILYNYLHGNSETTPFVEGTSPNQDVNVDDDENATLIQIGEGFTQGGPTTSNVDIEYNIEGDGVSDCIGRMEWIGNNLCCDPDTGDPYWFGYDQAGGFCTGVTMGGNLNHIFIGHNVINFQEQGLKGFEGGTSSPNLFVITDVKVQYNLIRNIHRIYHETQMSPTDPANPFTFQYNVLMDPVNASYGTWMLSAPQLTYTVANDNLVISNGSTAGPGNFEYWGNAQNNNNFEQGNIGCGTDFGFGTTSSNQVSNNLMQLTSTGGCNNVTTDGITHLGIQNEFDCSGDPDNCIPTSDAPTQANNNFTTSVSQQTSKAPVISPASGPISGATTVTLSVVNNGNSSGQGPRNNTGIWYTVDGSIPAPGAGTSKWYQAPFSVLPGTTVNAIGMWGDVVQPLSYSSPYGYIPSAVVTAAYTSGASPTLNSVRISLVGGGATVAQGSTVQACANLQYITPTESTQICGSGTDAYGSTITAWGTSSPANATVSIAGVVSGVAAGSSNLTVTAGGHTSPNFALTVSAPPAPTIVSGYQDNTASVNTLAVGAPAVQQQAWACYNTGPCAQLPDSNGNVATWSSSNPSVLTVGSTGLVSCAAAGTAQSQVSSGVTFSAWGWTCNASSTLDTVTFSLSGGGSNVGQGTPKQACANLAYVSPTANTQICGNGPDSFGTTVTAWTSATPARATISSSGLVTALTTGTSNMTVTAGGITSSAFAVTVPAPTITAGYQGNSRNIKSMVVGQSMPQVAFAQYTDGTTHQMPDPYGNTVTWSSSATGVLTVNSSGTATCAGVGTANSIATASTGLVLSPWTWTCLATSGNQASGFEVQE